MQTGGGMQQQQQRPQQTCCEGKGSLGFRMHKNLRINDLDGNGFVTGAEIKKDFDDNYDKNGDGCCSKQEWVSRWESYFKFSPEFAIKRLNDISLPGTTDDCKINVPQFLAANVINIPADQFVNDNIQSLVDLCRSDKNLTRTNCDCAQLYEACAMDSLMGKSQACKSVVVEMKSRHDMERQ